MMSEFKDVKPGCSLRLLRTPFRYFAISLFHHFTISLFLFLFTFSLFAQDRPPSNPVLPFQQDAVTAENEEQMASQFFQARDFEKAGELYSRIYQRKPIYYIYNYYFFCLVENGDFNEARKLIKNQQKLEPEAVKYQVDQGYLYFREGNTEKAKKTFEEAIRRLPANPGQVYELANVFYSRGELDYVVKTYQRGREMLPDYYPFGFELAGVYERTGNYQHAFEEYFFMLSLDKSYEATVRDRIQALLASDDDNEKNEVFRKLLLEKIQKDPENRRLSELMWWYSIQQKDFELALVQAKALDRRLKEDGNRVMDLASLAISNGNYKVAEEAFRYVMSKGSSCDYYESARRDLLHARYLQITGRVGIDRKTCEEMHKSLQTELQRWNANPQAFRIILDLAHLDAFYLDRPDDGLDLLDDLVQWRGLAKEELATAKLELADIHVYRGDLWTATVIYQQVYRDFKNDAIGQEAKFRSARLSFYMGEVKWAQAQLDILKAATSKFIANDALRLSLLISSNYDPDSNTVALGIYARADLADFRNKEEIALKTLDSIPGMFREHPILDDVIFRKGEIYLKYGNYPMADSMFSIVISHKPEDIITGQALMYRAAIHEENLKDKEGAMAYYQQVLNEYPGCIYVPEARKKYRELRGDKLK